MDKLVTFFTPTYNRAHILHRCYESLCAQTSYDFKWLIVDDGSTDDTAAVVKELQERTTAFQVDYLQKPNGGKHTALNYSHPYISGAYVVILDSDDTLVPGAVETILAKWTLFADNLEVGRIIFLKGFGVDNPICQVAHPGIPVDTLKESRIGTVGRCT